ncbi:MULTISPECIES: hypothetical protein [Streptomyces]|nr:hypothetical protein [Streptomyces venezuelae]
MTSHAAVSSAPRSTTRGTGIGGAWDGASPSQNQAVAYTVASVGP